MKLISKLSLLLLCTLFFYSSLSHANSKPKLFLFLGSTNEFNLSTYKNILINPCVTGVQIVYTWKELEPQKDNYDFSKIENDLRYLNSIHKKLFIQLQDRSFQPELFYVPDYIRNEAIY